MLINMINALAATSLNTMLRVVIIATMASFILAVATSGVFAHEISSNEVKHHYVTVTESQPYPVKVCKDKTALQGGVEGALIGAILGNIIGNQETGKAGALFGGIVGANEAKGQTCTTETRYREVTKSEYSHSTITFENEGRVYELRFTK